MSLDSYIADLHATLQQLPVEAIAQLRDLLYNAWREGRQVFTCGNGGSASTASHMAADLSKNVAAPGQPRLRLLPLTDNIPLMTAWANDSSYADIFAEQLRAHLQPGDLVIGISGSGNSENVLRALRLAKEMGGVTVGLSGFDGGQLRPLVNLSVHVANYCMEQVEDAHLMIAHMLAVELRTLVRQAPRPVLHSSPVIDPLGVNPLLLAMPVRQSVRSRL